MMPNAQLPYAQILATVLYCFLSKTFRISVNHSTKFNKIVYFAMNLILLKRFSLLKCKNLNESGPAVTELAKYVVFLQFYENLRVI